MTEVIRATEWENILIETGKTDQEKANDKAINELGNAMQDKLPRIEYFFNQVLPNVKL